MGYFKQLFDEQITDQEIEHAMAEMHEHFSYVQAAELLDSDGVSRFLEETPHLCNNPSVSHVLMQLRALYYKYEEPLHKMSPITKHVTDAKHIVDQLETIQQYCQDGAPSHLIQSFLGEVIHGVKK